jgi:ATP-dependent helicase YprA (DUF1998 family)/ribosomal protein S14
MSLDPIKSTNEIVGKYIDYLATTFSLKDSELQTQLVNKFHKRNKFSKGPILEATPPFIKGCSIRDLIKENILSEEFYDLKAEELPLERTLYLHQEQAIRKIIDKDRNIVVATGTGSGKTESFLIPILNNLFIEKENKTLDPGVRALLLYPMNALANDQLKRLRDLLKNYPHITFGSYTGETEEKYEKARERYHKMYKDAPLLENELISREQMKETPPHILITNYAMLEYLMLRPKDHTFFDEKYSESWKYIVLDEAHTYTGAKAIEMSMLLRRLKARVSTSDTKIKCIATSATIGSSENDFNEVASFGQKLFNETFEYEENNSRKQDVIKASKKEVKIGELNNSWGSIESSTYLKWKNVIESENDDKIIFNKVNKISAESNIPQNLIKKAVEFSNNKWRKYLYFILKNDENLIQLQRLLEEKAQYFIKIASIIFSDSSKSNDYLTALVFLANKAKPSGESVALLPARYHLFIRAIEGAYITFLPEKQLFLERKEKHKYQDQEFTVFEIGSCRQCNALYLIGDVITKNNENYLSQPTQKYYKDNSSISYFLVVDDQAFKTLDNEDEIKAINEANTKEEEYLLCPKCGNIKANGSLFSGCDCNFKPIKVIKAAAKKGQVHKCSACGSVRSIGSIVWRFLLGGDAVTSVLTTSLYQQLSSESKIEQAEVKENNSGWVSQNNETKIKRKTKSNINKRQLLVFSDSRQDAAFFPTYLESTYQQIVRRQLILKTIKQNKEKVLANEWRVQDLVNALKTYLSRKQIYPEKSLQEIEDLAWKWILYEFLMLDRKNSLEALGLLGFSFKKPLYFSAGPLEQYGLDDQQAWGLFQVLLNSFRKYGAILFPDNISPEDSFFEPRNREYYFKKQSSEYNIYSWLPTCKGILNSRLDFLQRLSEKGLDNKLSREECLNILRKIWDLGLNIESEASMFKGYFSNVHSQNQGQMYRLKLDYWQLKPAIIDSSIDWYYCSTCNRITIHNVKGTCTTYQCSGHLEKCNPKNLYKNNHYRNLYLDSLPIKMKSKEHTAQLTTEAAADIQSRFNEGDVNVLSCSTTFELGVDVGELESVFMRNVPPTPANYIQRAGRAGRRTDSTAFSLTFARRRSHDLTYFQNPLDIISGNIEPPHFKIKNDKIIKRHIYATALASFWRNHPEYFGTVEDFFFSEGIDKFYKYLKEKPVELKIIFKKIIPSDTEINLDNWKWIDKLIGENGVMNIAYLELENDIEQLEIVQYNLVQQEKFGKANVIKRVIRTLKTKYLINYMSQNNIIPKYGFPVDVVELKIAHHGDQAKSLELTRDLKIALSEYAPGSQVVAGGKLWTSRYLKTLPNKDLIRRKYAICEHCGHYHSVIDETEKEIDICQVCGKKIGKMKGTFVTPELGFISAKPEEPKMSRPEKTYSSRQYFTGEYNENSESIKEYNFNGIETQLISAQRGKLAVINHAGFKRFSVCQNCGYSEVNTNKKISKHKTPWGQDCTGKRNVFSLGYEYNTDILQLKFKNSYFGQEKEGYWESVLYGMLEGISQALGIERRDIDGCLYPYTGDPLNPALIFYDTVPGGAGHVERIIKKNNFEKVLKKTKEIVSRCECGGEEGDTSCYGCLRNYSNEYCHNILKRKYAIEFIDNLNFH